MRAIAAIGLLFLGTHAWALDASLTISDLDHWSLSKPQTGPTDVTSFSQIPGATLWIGTRHGLYYRFAESFGIESGSSNGRLPATDLSVVYVSADKSLWVGSHSGEVSRGIGEFKFTFQQYRGLPGGRVNDILQDPSGAMWVASDGGLAVLENQRWRGLGEESGLGAGAVLALFVDKAQSLWVATAKSVFERRRGQSKFQIVRSFPQAGGAARRFAQSPDGNLWISVAGHGLFSIRPSDVAAAKKIENLAGVPGDQVLFDRDGSLWLTGKDLRRIALRRKSDGSEKLADWHVERWTRADGLSGDSVRRLFEDDEGSIWIGTDFGIDQFTNPNFTRVVSRDSNEDSRALVADETGSVWVAEPSANRLLKVTEGRVSHAIKARALTSGTRAADGSIWFGGPDGVARVSGETLQWTRFPIEVRGSKVDAMARDEQGTLWVSLEGKGTYLLTQGAWAGSVPGLPRLTARVAAIDRRHVWFGYADNEVARVQDGVARVFTAADGLAIGSVNAFDVHDGVLWVGGDLGVATFDGARFRSVVPTTCKRFAGVTGLARTANGDLWINRDVGLSRIPGGLTQLTSNPDVLEARCENFGFRLGMPGLAAATGALPSLVESSDGRLWMETSAGLAWADPARLTRKGKPALGQVNGIFVGETYFTADKDLQLPPHTRAVQFSFALRNASFPYRQALRYRLSPLETKWRRSNGFVANYQNLRAGKYMFELGASNDGDEWSGRTDVLEFEILPAFYETQWFKVLCALLGLMMIGLIYSSQLRRAKARMQGRLEERVVERERIARDLHDTLLQSMQGLILRFDSVVRRISEEPLRADMNRALELADEVMIEGRDRVKELRDTSRERLDLSLDIDSTAQALAVGTAVEVNVTVQGAIRPLQPIVREEAFLIAREAVINALRHAAPVGIQVVLSYRRVAFSVCVKDDGRGIDPAVLQAGGRIGHWGLPGMHERARKLRGRLTVSSNGGAGTTIDLFIPGNIAYRVRSWKRWTEALRRGVDGGS